MAERLLAAPDAAPFFSALQTELGNDQLFPSPPPRTAVEAVQRIAGFPPEQVQPFFFVVRRALKRLPAQDLTARRPAEVAAAALYFLAACRLVDKAAHATAVGQHVLRVPSSERLVCAVIATALFGGELRVVADEHPELPSPEFVFDVKVFPGGGPVEEDFERAVYASVFANKRTTTEISLDNGPLNLKQRADLAAELDDIREVERASLALVVHGLAEAGPSQGFAIAHRVPVILPTTEATTALLGMGANRLVAEIGKLWTALESLRNADRKPRLETSTPSPREQAMTKPAITVNVEGDGHNVAISAGDHSAFQSGIGHTTRVDHRQGAELSALIPVLRDIAAAIAELPSTKARETLGAHAQAAETEVRKGCEPDASLIRRALDAIKSGAEMFDEGAKVVALCEKAYQAVAPYLSLPSSPQP
jgi:hypothetical protein